jgi:hypothetical protein
MLDSVLEQAMAEGIWEDFKLWAEYLVEGPNEIAEA